MRDIGSWRFHYVVEICIYLMNSYLDHNFFGRNQFFLTKEIFLASTNNSNISYKLRRYWDWKGFTPPLQTLNCPKLFTILVTK